MKRIPPTSEANVGKETGKTTAVPPTEPTHSPDGVDLTLSRWFLSLTPKERLIILQENVRALALMREGYRVPAFPRLVHVKGETVREIEEKKLAILRATLAEKNRK